ncbi:MAG: 23S rRNA pseudouridine(2604) synthase RluF [Tannerellaceae bacterium]
MIRLNKYIADSGYCSRREADAYIEQGRVTINGREAVIGYMVLPTDRVAVDGEMIKGFEKAKKRVYIVLNKPVGITCTTDLSDRTNIISYVKHRERIFPIGRLDKLSQGLILLTSDGDIVNKILRAGNAHQKEYIVAVNKPITDDFIQRMSAGMKLEDGTLTLPCKVFRENERSFRILLVQGLNRQIRRMCMMLRYNVEKLERVRIMNITLKGLPHGKWRELTEQEVKTIIEMVEGSDSGEQASKVQAPKQLPRPPGHSKQQTREVAKPHAANPRNRGKSGSIPTGDKQRPRRRR